MQGEPGADKLRDLQPDAVVNAVNAAEVLAKLVSRGMPAGEAQAAYDALHLATTPFEPAMVAISAATWSVLGRPVLLGGGPSARVRMDFGSRSGGAIRKPRSAPELFR